MNLKLLNLIIESFKGLQAFSMEPDGRDTILRAENGVGKTTVYDAWLWLGFGKDSTGRKEFELRPLNENNEPIKGLVSKVEAKLRIGTQEHRLRKEQHEKNVKGQLRGYETLCWIDEVPKKVGEFQDYIDSLIPEETFNILTDLSHFNTKMHWTDRRKTLLQLAGDTGELEGFEGLLSQLNGRKLDDYQKVLAEEKKRHTKERGEINPRLDEIQRGLNGYTEQDTSQIQTKRQAVQGTLKDLDGEGKELLSDEKARQERIDVVNKLTVQQLHRASQLRSEGNQTQKLVDEKAELQAEIGRKEEAVNGLHRQIDSLDTTLSLQKRDLAHVQNELDAYRHELAEMKNTPTINTCYACEQPLPKGKLAENEKRRKEKIAEADSLAKQAQQTVEAKTANIDQLHEQRKSLVQKATEALNEFKAAQATGKKRFAEIDAAIKNRPEPDYSQDAEWRKLNEQIEKGKAAIGESVSTQLEAIERRRQLAQKELDNLNTTLAQADRAKQDKARIEELKQKERDLSQQITEIDGQLAEIAEYKAAQSRRIEATVNGRFKYVNFKLFEYLLNGEVRDCCEATYNGVPYQDLSTGQQIRAGVDIINVLSEHYDLSVPLFVDHSESLTLPLEAKSQTIELFAEDGVKELVVEVAEKAVAA